MKVIFVSATILGFKRNLWLVVAAIFMHGIFDYLHGYLISNLDVPIWGSMFWLTDDVAAVT